MGKKTLEERGPALWDSLRKEGSQAAIVAILTEDGTLVASGFGMPDEMEILLSLVNDRMRKARRSVIVACEKKKAG